MAECLAPIISVAASHQFRLLVVIDWLMVLRTELYPVEKPAVSPQW